MQPYYSAYAVWGQQNASLVSASLKSKASLVLCKCCHQQQTVPACGQASCKAHGEGLLLVPSSHMLVL